MRSEPSILAINRNRPAIKREKGQPKAIPPQNLLSVKAANRGLLTKLGD